MVISIVFMGWLFVEKYHIRIKYSLISDVQTKSYIECIKWFKWIGTLVGRSWGLKSCLSQQYLEDLSCQTWTGVMVTTVFWFMIGYCLTNQRYLLLITNFDSCMYMNFFISCVKGSVHTNSVDLVLSFLSVKIGLISYHFVPQHEVIKYVFFFG